MKQPRRIAKTDCQPPKKQTVKKNPSNIKKKRWHPQYGTSKLEEDFAKNFLDKLGVEYTYQFEAKDIGRFYDYKIVDGPIIEIQGGYWHGDPRLYEEKNLNSIQKRSRRVDEYKKKWALLRGIPIYYFWEKDIRENPSKVMEELKKILYKTEDEKLKKGRDLGKKTRKK